MKLFRYLKVILWSFVGLRKKSEMEKDFHNLKIHYVIILGVFCCFVFVMGLLVIVSFIVN